MIGTVKKIVEPRGFGFIHADSGEDVCFHVSMLNGLDFTEQLVERRVRYEMSSDARTDRAKAVNVRAA